eukprot:SAG22_NODE_45_length_24718_cov_12.462448_13_plen_365_part_00
MATAARLGNLAAQLGPARPLAGPAAATQPPMRFGIIGAGSIANGSFAPALRESQHAELVAVSRRDMARAQEFADKHPGTTAYDDAHALLADPRVEAVIICTPGDSHAEYTIAAAKLGKHVLVEKPMAPSGADCRAMVEACEAAGVGLAVAYRRRTWPQVVKAQELIAAGEIGRTVCVRTHYSGGQGFSRWQLDPAAGGTMLEMAVHRIEVLLNFAGATARPQVVTALVEQVLEREDGAKIDDTDCLLLKFDDGKVGVHSTIMTSPPRRDAVQVDGTHGRIIIESLESGASELKIERAEGGVETIAVAPLRPSLYDLPMLDDLVLSIAVGRPPVCDGISGYYVSAVVDAAFESARTGTHQDVVQW